MVDEIESQAGDGGPEVTHNEDDQIKFEQRYKLFMSQLSDACEKHKIKTAVAVVEDPELPGGALTFLRGTTFDQAELIAGLLRRLKQQIFDRLDA